MALRFAGRTVVALALASLGVTSGCYSSTPHRVQNVTRCSRLSFPFFFDPSFDVRIKPVVMQDQASVQDDRDRRWDHASVHEFSGTYGDYLLAKVSKVFPELRRRVDG